MAKLFYTLEEAAIRLGMAKNIVQEMVRTGKLQEFRDGENLEYKKSEVDELADKWDAEHPSLAKVKSTLDKFKAFPVDWPATTEERLTAIEKRLIDLETGFKGAFV